MEKKRAYVKPSLESEAFVPNTYVAACGDQNVVYKFTCDAGGGVRGSVYQETNGRDGLQTRGGWGYRADRELTDWSWSYYYACNEMHEASTDDEFVEGYFCAGGNTRNAQKVIIWKGPNGDDIHCTTNLDMNSWITEKS